MRNNEIAKRKLTLFKKTFLNFLGYIHLKSLASYYQHYATLIFVKIKVIRYVLFSNPYNCRSVDIIYQIKQHILCKFCNLNSLEFFAKHMTNTYCLALFMVGEYFNIRHCVSMTVIANIVDCIPCHENVIGTNM